MLTRRQLFKYVAVIAVGAAVQASWAQADREKPRQKRPNIIIIYVDDLARGDDGAFGCPGPSTANIDTLARQGVTLTNAYTINAPCCPCCGANNNLTPTRPCSGIPTPLGSLAGNSGGS